jgi:hypothetical protein
MTPPLEIREREAREMLFQHTDAWEGHVTVREALNAMIAFADAERERCARIAEETTYALSIEEWMAMTKKEHGAYACHQVAAAIRNPLYQRGEVPPRAPPPDP